MNSYNNKINRKQYINKTQKQKIRQMSKQVKIENKNEAVSQVWHFNGYGKPSRNILIEDIHTFFLLFVKILKNIEKCFFYDIQIKIKKIINYDMFEKTFDPPLYDHKLIIDSILIRPLNFQLK